MKKAFVILFCLFLFGAKTNDEINFYGLFIMAGHGKEKLNVPVMGNISCEYSLKSMTCFFSTPNNCFIEFKTEYETQFQIVDARCLNNETK